MDRNLIEYVRQMRSSGAGDAKIRADLASAGWPPADVEAALVPVPLAAPQTQLPGADLYVRSPKDRKLGIFFLIGPFLTLIAVLILYSILSFAAASAVRTTAPVNATGAIGLQPASPAMTGMAVARAILGLVGILSVIGLIIGFPLGLIFLSRRRLREDVPYDDRSGKGPASIVPPEIAGWNWGAAGLTFIWGIYYHVWLSLLTFVPLFSVVWWIVLGVKGNEWAWRNNRWLSVEHFLATQRKWMAWGIAFFVLSVIMNLLFTAARTLLLLVSSST